MKIAQVLFTLRRRWVVVAHDLVWIPVSVALAYWLRFNLGAIPDRFLDSLYLTAAIALPLHAATFWLFGCYRGIWRFASVPDFVRIAKAVALGGLGTALGVALVLRLHGVPRSVLLLYPVLLGLSTGLMRLGYRILKDKHVKPMQTDLERALVVGAGRAGEALIRDLLRHGPFVPAGLVDDDPGTHGKEIQGVRVAGGCDALVEVVQGLQVDVVLVAIAKLPRARLAEIVRACARAGARCRIMPPLDDIAHGRIDAAHMRPVTVDDLLGREPVCLDHPRIADFLKGRRILVTGGGGSIGSELCRQLADHDPELLVIVDHSEYSLYRIEQELLARPEPVNFVKVLGDVRGPAIVEPLFRRYAPQIVFHAAAYKHVPMVEDNPTEGVWNNVFGTCNVADTAVNHGASHFVLISTDKTVNPTSVMGATKRIAELYCQSLGRETDTRFITTRFGNVLGSTGSVVPHFERQIEKGGPVTVTHADVTRYFMTIGEAVSLILQAGAIGRGGEIFVMDMGKPIRIRELAEKLIGLSGLVPGRDIKIEYTGLRPGEKMHEELFYKDESLRGTAHPKLLLASCHGPSPEVMEAAMGELEKAAIMADEDAVSDAMRALVPQYRPEEPARRVVGTAALKLVK